MALYRKPTTEKNPQEWVQERKKIATAQLLRIPDLVCDLFSSNDWTPFLRLISRLPSYSYFNLLIIYDKYPAATNLAGFSVWQQQMASEGSDAKVLKPDAIRNGIDLVIPFTSVIGDQNFEAIWHSVLVFDIKQTNVRSAVQSKSPYTSDGLHTFLLRDAVTSVIGFVYKHRVIFDIDQEGLKASGAKGRILHQTVTVMRDAGEEEALFWLSEALCQLSVADAPLSEQARLFLQQCVQYVLFGMWEIYHPGILPGSQSVVPETERVRFLELLQKTVFDLHQKVAGFYLMLRDEHGLD